MLLVIGPTSAGKSTYVSQLQASSAEKYDVHFAFQIKGPDSIPRGERDIVHVNLLHGLKTQRRSSVSLNGIPELDELIEAADEVVVLCAPRSVLLQRSAQRTQAEPDQPGHRQRSYDQELWSRALESPHLAQMYEQLALRLDDSETPHSFRCTNTEVHQDSSELARWEFPRMASDDAEEACRRGHATPSTSGPSGTYQSDHRIGPVSASLSLALQMPLDGKRLLDIGCAEGAVALSASRMGARVTGIEPRARRIKRARRAAEEQGADAEFVHTTLDDYGVRNGSFDVVMALNVVHHVPNPFAFLDRAAQLTSSHLVLEYPGLEDTKYLDTLDVDGSASQDQPLIAVSHPSADQTFVFNPASLERYFLDIVGTFGKHHLMRSPMPNRWLSVFSEKRAAAGQELVTVAQLQAKLAKRDKRVATLQRKLDEIESSRSWRVTAPLRRAGKTVRERSR